VPETKPPEGNRVATCDPIVIAAMFSGALFRESGAIIDPELLCRLLNRFHLTPPSTMMEAHQCNT
jgi:hypothetical protein